MIMDRGAGESVNDLFTVRRNELAAKYIKLQIVGDSLLANAMVIEEKRKAIKREYDTLDEFNKKVWLLQDQTCDEVWDFSSKHDINTALKNYPHGLMLNFLNCNCDVQNITRNVEKENLIVEIEKLESDLESLKCKDLNADLITLGKKLLEAKEEYQQMFTKLTESITGLQNRIADLKSNVQTKSNAVPVNKNLNNNFENNISEMSNLDTSSVLANKMSISAYRPVMDEILESNSPENLEQNVNILQFVKASTFLKNREKKFQFKVSSCEKVISRTNSGKSTVYISMNQPKTTFVLKSKSLITQRYRN